MRTGRRGPKQVGSVKERCEIISRAALLYVFLPIFKLLPAEYVKNQFRHYDNIALLTKPPAHDVGTRDRKGLQEACFG